MPAHKQQPPAKNSYSQQTIWKPLQPLQTCTGRRRAWWEQLSGLCLVHHIDSRCSYLSKSVGRGCGDGGVERQTVRSLREYSGWWILCFLAVTPTGFINSLVKTGKARCGLSAFWSKCAGGVLCNVHLDSDCRTQLIPIFRCPGPVEGSLAARLLIFSFSFF